MRNSLIFLSLVSFFASSVFAQQPNKNASRIEVPFTMDRNLVIIKATINNLEERSFIFDTGTGGIVLSEAIAEKHNLKSSGFALMKSPNGGMSEKLRMVKIP